MLVPQFQQVKAGPPNCIFVNLLNCNKFGRNLRAEISQKYVFPQIMLGAPLGFPPANQDLTIWDT